MEQGRGLQRVARALLLHSASNSVTVDGPDAISAPAAGFFEVYHSTNLRGLASFCNPMSFTRMEVSKMRFTLAAVLCAVACCQPVRAQVARPTILRIEVANAVRYVDDVADVTTIATNPSATTAIPIKNFRRAVLIGDIVAVNGQPAKGTVIENTRDMILRTTPTPGQGIADITRDAMLEWMYEILNVDGSPVGSLMVLGAGGGTPPPGATPLATQGNN